MAYADEFPDFTGDVPEILSSDGWRDASWKNDAMPFFVHEPSGVAVWVNYPASDLPNDPAFVVVKMTHDSEHGWQHGDDVTLFETDDAATLTSSLPNFLQPHEIAHCFANIIENQVGEHMAEIKRRNASPEYSHGCCATHDFCDANMPMNDAFEETMGRPFLPESSEPTDDDMRLWNLAWEIARKERFM